jgi:hypothetical protein
MDAADIRAAAQRAREFTHTIGERSFTLRAPTRTELRETIRAHGLMSASGDVLALPLLCHYLLLRGLVGWAGVRVCDLGYSTDTAPLPWSADAVQVLADAQPDWADAMGSALLAKSQARTAEAEADAKN